MPLSDTIKTLIRNAWDDGYPFLLATNGPQGTNITPKGSMIVFDDAHLAWWERSKRGAGEPVIRQARVRDVRQFQGSARRPAGQRLPAVFWQR